MRRGGAASGPGGRKIRPSASGCAGYHPGFAINLRGRLPGQTRSCRAGLGRDARALEDRNGDRPHARRDGPETRRYRSGWTHGPERTRTPNHASPRRSAPAATASRVEGTRLGLPRPPARPAGEDAALISEVDRARVLLGGGRRVDLKVDALRHRRRRQREDHRRSEIKLRRYDQAGRSTVQPRHPHADDVSSRGGGSPRSAALVAGGSAARRRWSFEGRTRRSREARRPRRGAAVRRRGVRASRRHRRRRWSLAQDRATVALKAVGALVAFGDRWWSPFVDYAKEGSRHRSDDLYVRSRRPVAGGVSSSDDDRARGPQIATPPRRHTMN